jgi:DNA polymerase I-like protein with 3'-5' exonuclease and polymerase domains
MPDSILKKALEFLGEVPVEVTPSSEEEAPKNGEYKGTNKYELITSEGDLLHADQQLCSTFPNLIFQDSQADRVIFWIRAQDSISLDIETHGQAKWKEQCKKEALSFVRGTIRLVQLSSGDETYTLDAALLPEHTVARVLRELHGKPLYLHNAIFDLPRLLRTFGVDLLGEDIRDSMVLSRLYQAGQWEYIASKAKPGITATVNLKHNIRDVLSREIGVEISKETGHRWNQPLTEARMRYASDDVEQLKPLYHDLLAKVEKDGMLDAYRLIQKVYPTYMRQQARGVPFDAELYEKMRARLKEKLEILDAQLWEHAPEHPDEEGRWVWRNNRKPEEVEGRNGALRALALAGTPLNNLRKSTRLAFLKKNKASAKAKPAPLLEALDQYLKHADLEGDTRGWLDLYYEDGRLYPNVRFFSQVTGRSAYSGPALQNIAKTLDLPGMENLSFRDCVQAPPGWNIVKADYSAQELRILAHITQDENLLDAFLAQSLGGKDPHMIVGEKIAGKELEKNTPEGKAFRAAGKRANYGFSYGAGWRRYQTSIYEDAAELIPDQQAISERQAFQEAWPKVYRWQQIFGDRQGHESEAWYTTSFLGRRRYVSRSRDGKPSYNDRLNGPIQQGGADQLYLALGKLEEDPLPSVHVIITTHDEVVLECKEEVVVEAKKWLFHHMREAVRETIGDQLATEDCVEVEIAGSWGG